VSAPHSVSTTFATGVSGGRIARSVVTIRSAARHCHSRQRRIGSAISSRSTARFGEPG
jgi:hypothetical protein